MAEKQSQLVELALPPSVDRLDWISSHIEVLNAAGCSNVHSLRGLPKSLRELDIRQTAVQSLEFIPRALKVLDIRETQIAHLAGLPSKLESLKVSGENISRLGNLPPSLRDLHLSNTKLSDLTGLPAHLQSLYLEGENFDNLDGLPETLQSLTLEKTKVRSLKSLPPALQRLNLTENISLRFQPTDLPPLLTWLVLDQEQWTPDLSGLRYLYWYSDRRPYPSPALPRFLSALTLRVPGWGEPEWQELSNFPRSLRALGLLHARISIENLPPELEVLDLTGYARTEMDSLRYLARLRRLEIRYASLTKLPELPPNLEALVLSGTAEIRSLQELRPTRLNELVFCESKLKQLDGRTDLPPSLKRLDLCESRSLENLSSVPDGLTYLNLKGTGITKLPMLREELQELDVSNTKIERLDLHSLPKSLRTLTVSEGQLDSLADLPPKVTALRIVQAEKLWENPPAKN